MKKAVPWILALFACLPAGAATRARRGHNLRRTATHDAVAKLKPSPLKPAPDRIDRAVNQLLARSDYYWHQGDWDSVRYIYSVITDLDPTYLEGWQNYGWLHWSGLNNNAAAMRVFQRGLKYHPNEYELYFEIGNLEYHQRHFESAALWMAKATARPNAPFTAWHMRAHCLEYAGQYDKAKALWRTIVAKYPDDAPAKLNLKRMESGRYNTKPAIGVEGPKTEKPQPRNNPEEITTPQDPNSI